MSNSSSAVKDGIKRSTKAFEMALLTNKEKTKNHVKRSKDGHLKNYNENRLNKSFDNKPSIENIDEDHCFHDYFDQDIIEFQEDEILYFNDEKNFIEDDNLEKKEPAIELRIPSFDMKNLSKNLTILSIHSSFLQRDNGRKLKHGGKVRKGSFARAMHNWSLEFNVSPLGLDSLMNILNNTFEGYELPVKTLSQRTKVELMFHTLDEFKNRKRIEDQNSFDEVEEIHLDNNDDSEAEFEAEFDEKISLCTEDLCSNIKVHACIRNYCKRSVRYVSVDQCECDNYVYAGNNNQFNCPECNKLRFRACTRSLCDGKGEALCEHLRSADGDGIAFKQLFFRPLLVLISDLLRTPNFLCSLRYERAEQILNPAGVGVQTYSDLMDGDEVKHHLLVMNSRYNLWRESKPE
jgi:hypothetical protein